MLLHILFSCTFFLGLSIDVFMASFLRPSLGRRCLLITKSMEGPTSTSSILGMIVPDFLSLKAQCVRKTRLDDTAVQT